MRFIELSKPWQRVFSLAWESLLHGSKAIAAVIVSDSGEIISEGRNRIAENYYPNYRIAHAENEAVMNLDVRRHPHLEKYTLYAGLEPCAMCFGTMVMGHINHIVIAAKDGYGGAMELRNATNFLKNRNVIIEYTDPLLGYVQRTMQAIRELIKNDDICSREHTLAAISIIHPQSVEAAKRLVKSRYIQKAIDENAEYGEIFNKIIEELVRLV